MDVVVDPGYDNRWTCVSHEALNRTAKLAHRTLRAECAALFDSSSLEPRVLVTTADEPALAAQALDLCRVVITTGAPVSEPDDGLLHPMALGVPVHTADARQIGVLCVLCREARRREPADLEALEALAASLGDQVDAANRLREIDRAERSRLAAMIDVNHELRTPLQAIVGFTEFLKSETRPHLIADHARTIQAAAQSVLAIVNQTLEVAGDVEASREIVEIRPFAETCLSMVEPVAIQKGLDSRLVIDDGVPASVRLDRQKVSQALLNLLNNAVKFTDRGGFALQIGRVGSGLRFAVADTGIGIAESERDRLFLRFSRIGAEDRQTGGTGLGLAITKALVESMEGTIGVTPGVGGTIFWFELPETDVSAEDAPRPAAAAMPTTDVRILIADDLDLNRKLIADMLAIGGYDVDCVADGAAAVAAAREKSYALVLMDMIMPGMDGLAAARAIRALPAPACHVPIVALTANCAEDQLESCLEAGMNATLTKPMTFHGLSSAVATWLRPRSKAA